MIVYYSRPVSERRLKLNAYKGSDTHSSPLRNDDTTIPGTRIEPKSDKESSEVETTKEKEVEITKEKEIEFVDKIVEITSDAASPEQENTNDQEVELAKETPVVEITNVVIPVNVDDEEEEIIDEVYELKRWEKGKIVEETRNSPIPTPTRSPRNLSNLGRYGYLFAHLRARFMPRKSSDQLADDLHDVMVETLPSMVKEHVREQVKKQVPEQVRDQVPVYVAKGISSEIQKAIDDSIPSQVDASVRSYMFGHILYVHPAQSQTASVPEQQYQLTQVPQTTCKTSAVRPRDQEDPHDDAHPEGENSVKRQKTSEYEAYVSLESLSGQVNEEEPVSQDIMEEVSLTIDEVKLKKMADEMLRQRCTSEMNIIESELLSSPHPRKATPLVLSCQRDPEAPALSLINQDLLYLKKGNSGLEKIVLSHHKFPAVSSIDDDMKYKS
ncbi:hypothetical protein Tco_1303253 [Tanacetum coccineum]